MVINLNVLLPIVLSGQIACGLMADAMHVLARFVDSINNVFLCIHIQEAVYSLSLRSFDPSIIVGYATIPSSGVVTSRPYRKCIIASIASRCCCVCNEIAFNFGSEEVRQNK